MYNEYLVNGLSIFHHWPFLIKMSYNYLWDILLKKMCKYFLIAIIADQVVAPYIYNYIYSEKVGRVILIEFIFISPQKNR